jgi:RimJ/RimL family protein N-acetyltransferase
MDFYKELFKDGVPVNEMPVKGKRPKVHPLSDREITFDYDNEELQAIFQLSKTQNKFTKAIQFLVVNPQTQNRGIGTRIFNSILTNSEFFKKLKSQLFLVSASEKSNNASRRLLKKQGFIPYKKVNNSTLCLYIKLWKSKEMGE